MSIGIFKFDPNQPRAPKGSPEGGQWTSTRPSLAASRAAEAKLLQIYDISADLGEEVATAVHRSLNYPQNIAGHWELLLEVLGEDNPIGFTRDDYLALVAGRKRIRAVDNYTGNGYEWINGVLRHGPSAAPGMWQVVVGEIKAMDELFEEQGQPRHAPVYRGVSGEASRMLASLVPGQEFQDLGFVSTSEHSHVAVGFLGAVRTRLLKIHFPTPARVLAPEERGEGEYILPRGARFRVRMEQPSPTTLDVDYLGSEPSELTGPNGEVVKLGIRRPSNRFIWDEDELRFTVTKRRRRPTPDYTGPDGKDNWAMWAAWLGADTEDTWQLVAKYDPNQPRAPKGVPAGGQWVASGGGATATKDPALAGEQQRWAGLDLESVRQEYHQLLNDAHTASQLGDTGSEQLALRYLDAMDEHMEQRWRAEQFDPDSARTTQYERWRDAEEFTGIDAESSEDWVPDNKDSEAMYAGESARQTTRAQRAAEPPPLGQPVQSFTGWSEDGIEVTTSRDVESAAGQAALTTLFGTPGNLRAYLAEIKHAAGPAVAHLQVKLLGADRTATPAGSAFNSVSVKFMATDAAGHEVYRSERFFRRTDDGAHNSVYHDHFYIAADHQDSGIGRAVTQASMRAYQRMGYREVETYANSSVGGYAWARMGFVPKRDVRAGLEESVWRLAKSHGRITEAQATALIERLRTARHPIWELADARVGDLNVGFETLGGDSWGARFDLTDPEAMARLFRVRTPAVAKFDPNHQKEESLSDHTGRDGRDSPALWAEWLDGDRWGTYDIGTGPRPVAKFNPAQPRAPKGTPSGGQWVDEDGGGVATEEDDDYPYRSWERRTIKGHTVRLLKFADDPPAQRTLTTDRIREVFGSVGNGKRFAYALAEQIAGSAAVSGDDTIEIKFRANGGILEFHLNTVNDAEPFPSVTMLRVFGKEKLVMEDNSLQDVRVVWHQVFKIASDGQQHGVGRAVIQESLRHYRQMDVSHVRLTANSEVGGYAWARLGWRPSDEHTVAQLHENVSHRLSARRHLWPDDVTARLTSAVAGFRQPDPASWTRAIRDIADARYNGENIGEALLAGTSWKGVLHLNDDESMGRAMRVPVKKFNPEQPRHPAGTPQGGQWAPAGGAVIMGGTKVGGQGGSNPGGVFQGSDGTKRYVKFYADPAQAYGEHLANRIYEGLGLGAPKSEVFEHKGKVAYASEYLTGYAQLGTAGLTKERADSVLDGFAADILTGNWDAVGLVLDNVLIKSGAPALRIDNGGTFLMRAQAGRKPPKLLHQITEWEGFAPGGVNPSYARIFKAAGLPGPTGMLPRLQEQVAQIEALRDAWGGWDRFTAIHAPGWSGADRTAVVEMLDARTALLRARVGAVAKYDPNQPRVPAGSAAGGQWAASGGGGTAVADAEDIRTIEMWSQFARRDGYRQVFDVGTMRAALEREAQLPDVVQVAISDALDVRPSRQLSGGDLQRRWEDLQRTFGEDLGAVGFSSSDFAARAQVQQARFIRDGYVSTGHKPINYFLRAEGRVPTIVPGSEKFTAEQVAALDDLFELDGFTVKERLYRGVAGPIAEQLRTLRPGDEFSDRGFVSTSRSVGIARNFSPEVTIRVTLPSPARVLQGSYEESERILPRGARFRVIPPRPGTQEERDYDAAFPNSRKPTVFIDVEYLGSYPGPIPHLTRVGKMLSVEQSRYVWEDGDLIFDVAKYDPNQPRHPAGTPQGGQWAPTGPAQVIGGNGTITDPKATVVFRTGTTDLPKSLNGIAFSVWTAPTTLEGWQQVAGQHPGLAESPLELKQYSYRDKDGNVVVRTKRAGAGVLVREPDGRVWVVEPRNHFGGYRGTFPKGTVEEGLTLQQTAIKEAYEESGLHVRITGLAGDVERDESTARYYWAERIGGDPRAHGWESQSVRLVPVEWLHTQLNRSVDRDLAAKHLGAPMPASPKPPRLPRLTSSGRIELPLDDDDDPNPPTWWTKLKRVIKRFDPNQPRAPKGTPIGGQWIDEDMVAAAETKLKTNPFMSSSMNIWATKVAQGVYTHEQAWSTLQSAWVNSMGVAGFTEADFVALTAKHAGTVKASTPAVGDTQPTVAPQPSQQPGGPPPPPVGQSNKPYEINKLNKLYNAAYSNSPEAALAKINAMVVTTKLEKQYRAQLVAHLEKQIAAEKLDALNTKLKAANLPEVPAATSTYGAQQAQALGEMALEIEAGHKPLAALETIATYTQTSQAYKYQLVAALTPQPDPIPFPVAPVVTGTSAGPLWAANKVLQLTSAAHSSDPVNAILAVSITKTTPKYIIKYRDALLEYVQKTGGAPPPKPAAPPASAAQPTSTAAPTQATALGQSAAAAIKATQPKMPPLPAPPPVNTAKYTVEQQAQYTAKIQALQAAALGPNPLVAIDKIPGASGAIQTYKSALINHIMAHAPAPDAIVGETLSTYKIIAVTPTTPTPLFPQQTASKMGAIYHPYRASLPEAQKKAVSYYQGSGYAALNAHRFNPGAPLPATHKALDTALYGRQLPFDMHVIRNISSKTLASIAKGLEGRVVQDPAYMSTGLHGNFHSGANVSLRLNLPKGTRGMYISGGNYGYGSEEEFLMPRNTRFRVWKVETKGPTTYIYADVLPPDEQPEIPS